MCTFEFNSFPPKWAILFPTVSLTVFEVSDEFWGSDITLQLGSWRYCSCPGSKAPLNAVNPWILLYLHPDQGKNGNLHKLTVCIFCQLSCCRFITLATLENVHADVGLTILYLGDLPCITVTGNVVGILDLFGKRVASVLSWTPCLSLPF